MTLRAQVLRGSAYMGLRQVVGAGVGLVGTLAATRLIGPEGYGLFAAAQGLWLLPQMVCMWGIGTYLTIHEGEVEAALYDHAFTLQLLLGVAGTVLALALLPFLQTWMSLPGLGPVAAALLLALPVNVVSEIPLASLERALDYRRIAQADFASQLVFNLGIVGLALRGWGVWSLVTAWWISQLVSLGMYCWGARYRPRLCWDRAAILDMLGYGLSFSIPFWLFSLRQALVPLVLGRYLGAPAVGFVALANKLVQVLGFMSNIAFRISQPVLARVQQDRPRLLRAVEEGTRVQLLSIGLLLAAMGLAAPWLVPWVFGERWQPTAGIYPFIAARSLTTVLLSIPVSALLVLRRNRAIIVYALLNCTLFAALAGWLVPILGLTGYGLGELTIAVSGLSVLAFTSRYVGDMDYRALGLCWSSLLLALFWQYLGWWSLLPFAVWLCGPGARMLRQLRVTYSGGW